MKLRITMGNNTKSQKESGEKGGRKEVACFWSLFKSEFEPAAPPAPGFVFSALGFICVPLWKAGPGVESSLLASRDTEYATVLCSPNRLQTEQI